MYDLRNEVQEKVLMVLKPCLTVPLLFASIVKFSSPRATTASLSGTPAISMSLDLGEVFTFSRRRSSRRTNFATKAGEKEGNQKDENITSLAVRVDRKEEKTKANPENSQRAPQNVP